MTLFLKLHKALHTNTAELLVVIAASVVSVITLLYYYNRNLILAYGDAESHINIAKRVVNSITPGFGQLGGVWLPLHHVLMIPFVWDDFLWRSGLAGSFESMICYVLSALLIFRMVQLATDSAASATIGAAVFILNPNILYMQVTPLGELPLIVMLQASVYTMAKWAETDNFLYLIASAFFVACGSLIRYDAWFLIPFSVLVLLVIGIRSKMKFAKIEGRFLLFITVAATGVLFWLGWNAIIFKNPVYFLTSPYSAKSQQLAWLQRGQLPSYHHLKSSLAFYTLDVIENTGVIIAILAAVSLVVSLYVILRAKNKSKVDICALLLLTPYPFYVITLFLGISIILLPQLTPASFFSNMFNVRYGVMLVPAVAVYVGMLYARVRLLFLRSLLIGVIAAQVIIFTLSGMPIVLQDGINGLSARRPSPVNDFVRTHYDYGLIMFDDFSRSANPVSLGVPMQDIVYAGNHPYWEVSLQHPSTYIRWLIIRHDQNDVLWANLQHNRDFLKNYYAVNNNGKTYVYKRRGTSMK